MSRWALANAKEKTLRHGPFKLCDSLYHKSNFQTFYDTSHELSLELFLEITQSYTMSLPGKDFFLDRAEFGSALVDMPYCCGGDSDVRIRIF